MPEPLWTPKWLEIPVDQPWRINKQGLVRDYVQSLIGKVDEGVLALFVDDQMFLVKAHSVAQKEMAFRAVSMPVMISRALQLGATSVIIVHNHPERQLSPSIADLQIARELGQVAREMGQQVLARVVLIGDEQLVRVAEL